MLDELDFVAFRRIDKSDDASAASLSRTIGKRIAFFGGLLGECFEVIHLEREVRDVETNIDRTALIELANLNLFFTAGSLEENQFRAAGGL